MFKSKVGGWLLVFVILELGYVLISLQEITKFAVSNFWDMAYKNTSPIFDYHDLLQSGVLFCLAYVCLSLITVILVFRSNSYRGIKWVIAIQWIYYVLISFESLTDILRSLSTDMVQASQSGNTGAVTPSDPANPWDALPVQLLFGLIYPLCWTQYFTHSKRIKLFYPNQPLEHAQGANHSDAMNSGQERSE